jgi:hypothetical protein
MNKAFSQSILGTTFLFLALVGGSQTTAWAQSEKARHNRIVGVWDVQVTVRNCNNGIPLFNFSALHKYELGGIGQVVPATNPTALSAHISVWKPLEKNVYQMAFKMFRFDAAGNNIGWVVVRNDVAITADGIGYAGSGRAETFDSNGNSVGASCPTFTGTRFQ